METAILTLSWIGTCLTSINLVPQVYKVIKTKETKSISVIWLSIQLTATLVWATYAILSMQWAILVTNILVFSTALIIFIFKIYNIQKKGERF